MSRFAFVAGLAALGACTSLHDPDVEISLPASEVIHLSQDCSDEKAIAAIRSRTGVWSLSAGEGRDTAFNGVELFLAKRSTTGAYIAVLGPSEEQVPGAKEHGKMSTVILARESMAGTNTWAFWMDGVRIHSMLSGDRGDVVVAGSLSRKGILGEKEVAGCAEGSAPFVAAVGSDGKLEWVWRVECADERVVTQRVELVRSKGGPVAAVTVSGRVRIDQRLFGDAEGATSSVLVHLTENGEVSSVLGLASNTQSDRLPKSLLSVSALAANTRGDIAIAGEFVGTVAALPSLSAKTRHGFYAVFTENGASFASDIGVQEVAPPAAFLDEETLLVGHNPLRTAPEIKVVRTDQRSEVRTIALSGTERVQRISTCGRKMNVVRSAFDPDLSIRSRLEAVDPN